MAVVNMREWMEEPLLKAAIDPLTTPEESKGLNVAQGFQGTHKGADKQASLNKDIVLLIAKQLYCGRKEKKNTRLGERIESHLLCIGLFFE